MLTLLSFLLFCLTEKKKKFRLFVAYTPVPNEQLTMQIQGEGEGVKVE